MFSLKKHRIKDKKVLIRIDINSSIKNKKVQINNRFLEHAKTIKYLLKNKAKLVILAHQGRKGKDDFTDLKQHAKILSKLIKKKINYVDDLFGKKAISEIKKLKSGQAILLQNVRKLYYETKELAPEQHSRTEFVKTLAPLFDIFILDAFSVSHRSHASVVGFAKAMKKQKKKTLMGFVLENEIRNLKKFTKDIKKQRKNTIYLLSGMKPEEDLSLLKQAIKQKTTVLLGGTFCLLYLTAKGTRLGKSDELLKKHKNLTKEMRRINYRKIIAPIDFAIEHNKKRKEVSLDSLPTQKPLLDLGRKTIALYKKEIKKAKIIILKGPLGKYEDKNFSLATKEVFSAVASSNAFSIIGGGNTIDAINQLKISKKKFSYISLGGGALLEYLSGKKLPGISELSS